MFLWSLSYGETGSTTRGLFWTFSGRGCKEVDRCGVAGFMGLSDHRSVGTYRASTSISTAYMDLKEEKALNPCLILI